MKKTIYFVLFWLCLVNLFALFALNRLNLKADTAYPWIDPQKTAQEQSWNPITIHARWDSFWHLDIAENGYSLKENDTLANVVFFPLYPFLIKSLAFVTGQNYILAGSILSMLFLIGSVAVFYKLIKEFHPSLEPEKPIFYLLIFPTAFFLTAVYTESLFLFLSLLTFYFTFKGRFGLAGLFGFLAALTRITGILLFIPVAWEYLQNRGARRLLKFEFLKILLIPVGTLSFFLYHYLAFGDFFLFLKVESAWGRGFTFNKEHFSFLSNPAAVNFLLDLMFGILALVATYLAFRKIKTSYALYMLSTIIVAVGTGTLMSLGRYILVLFPIYLSLATIKNKNFEKIYELASILLLALNIVLFVNYYWAG